MKSLLNWSYKYDQQGALLTFRLTSGEVQITLTIQPEVKSHFVKTVMEFMYRPYLSSCKVLTFISSRAQMENINLILWC